MITIKQNTIVAYAYKDYFTKWLPYVAFQKLCPGIKPNYCRIPAQTMVLETDFPNKEENKKWAFAICECLEKSKVSYKLYWTGNKSYHIFADFPELAKLDSKRRKKAKELLAKKLLTPILFEAIDKCNFKTKRLIGIPGTPHKNTGLLKTLVAEKSWGENKVPEGVLEKVEETTMGQHTNKKSVVGITRCAFLEYACTNRLPEGQRNQLIAPNLMAVMPEKAEQFAVTQGMAISQVNRWKNTFFSCTALRHYAENNGLRNLCLQCLEEVL